MFPYIDFDPLYSEKDKKLITFIVHSVMREYAKALEPFNLWGHPIAKITLMPSLGPGFSAVCGLTNLSKDTIQLGIPINISGMLLYCEQ